MSEGKKVTFNLNLTKIYIFESENNCCKNRETWLEIARRKAKEAAKKKRKRARERKQTQREEAEGTQQEAEGTKQEAEGEKNYQGTEEITEEGDRVHIPRNGLFL